MEFTIKDFCAGTRIRYKLSEYSEPIDAEVQSVSDSLGLLLTHCESMGLFYVGPESVVEIVSAPDENNPNFAFKRDRS